MKTNGYYCMRYYVTYRCSSRCQYCNVWQDPRFRGVRELGLEEAQALIAQGYEAGVRYIDFTGGEPTLYPYLPELLRYARGLGIKTEVTTNGLSGEPGRLRETAQWADKFNLSLDTLDPDAYRRLRGVGRLEDALETMEALAPIRIPRIMTVVTRENLSELDRLVRYAQERRAEIYLNPVFAYFGQADGGVPEAIQAIAGRAFEPYTVVMLHFLEFLGKPGAAGRPPCSANRRTLTVGPDGGLLLPCYHGLKETAPRRGSLSAVLEGDAFARYAGPGAQQDCAGDCPVVPYFGISFNFRLDGYFLLQSYSEKLNHLKRDYLNRLPELEPDTAALRRHLEELLAVIRSLETRPEPPPEGLYWAEETGRGWCTDVYREPLSPEQYAREREAEDCWQLSLAPHHAFDQVVGRYYRNAFAHYQDGGGWEAVREVFQDAMEFQLRLWKYQISRYMNASAPCGLEEEKAWLDGYLHRLERWG